MKKTIKAMILGLLMVPVLALSMPAITSAETTDEITKGVNAVNTSTTCLFTSASCPEGIFTKIINTALFIIGVLSVIMLIYGGIRYTISAGDSKQVEAAKNTILYAIIGIIVALLAGAIVNFVLSSF